MPSLIDAAQAIQQFEGDSLKRRLLDLENGFARADKQTCQALCADQDITGMLLESAFTLKQVASQINVIIHAVGILMALPCILKEGEVVQALSLGAGNTGRSFDLETDLRVAEFKFIQWRG